MLKMTIRLLAVMCIFAPFAGQAGETPAIRPDAQTTIQNVTTEELIAKAPAAEAQPSTDLIWLLDSKELEVRENFGTSKLVRQVVKVLTPAGVRAIGQTQIGFESGEETVEIIKAVTYDGANEYPAPQEGITEISDGGSEYNMYSNYKYKVISLSSLKPGVTVEVTYRITREKPRVDGKFSESFHWQSYWPVQQSRFTLIVPKGMQFQHVVTAADIQSDVVQEEHRTIYQWSGQNASAIKQESYMPDGDELAPAIVVTNWKSWEEIGQWYSELTQPSLEVTEPVRQMAREITQGREETNDKIAALYQTIAQQVRYVSLSFGIGGYRPHPADQTLKNRYGDCKDKATLLVTSLSELGIKAHLVLVNATSRQFYTDAPELGAFDHCIVAIPQGDGYLFLDPTSQTSSFGNLPTSDQNKFVLVIKGKDSHLVKTPQRSVGENQISVVMDCELTAEGQLQGTATWTTAGAYDSLFRELLLDETPEDQVKKISQLLATVTNRPLTISDIVISEVTDLSRPMSISFKIHGDEYGSTIGDMLAVNFPELLWLDATLAKITATSEREHAAVMGFLLSINSEARIRLPRGYEVMTLPKGISVENPAGSYTASYEQSENAVQMKRSLSLKAALIPAAEYSSLQELVRAKSKELRKQLVLKGE